MMSAALLAINLAACAVIAFTGVFMAVNNMSRCTDRVIRLAWIFITTGAFGVLAGVMYGQTQSSIADVALHVGVAIFAYADRRRYRKDATKAERGTSTR